VISAQEDSNTFVPQLEKRFHNLTRRRSSVNIVSKKNNPVRRFWFDLLQEGRQGNVTTMNISYGQRAHFQIESVESQFVLCQIYRGKNEIQASLISLASAGATPTPAAISREVIRPPDCKSGVTKYVPEETNWSVTSASHHFHF
jgi:hypothetical protein